MHQQKIAVILNGNAGKHTSREGLGRQVASILAPPELTFVTESVDDLPRVMGKIADAGVDIVLPGGGDGTVSGVTTAMIRHYVPLRRPMPSLMPVPLGTVLVVGTEFGHAAYEPVDLAERFAAKRGRGEMLDETESYPIEVAGRYGYVFGLGLLVNILHRYYEAEVRGTRRVMEIGASSLWQEGKAKMLRRPSPQFFTRPVRAKVLSTNGESEVCPHYEHVMLGCSAVTNLGYGCKAMPLARSRANHFMLRSSQLGYWQMLRHVSAIWAGESLPNTYDRVAAFVQIELSRPEIATLDGELLPAMQTLHVRSGPCVKIVVP